MKLAMIEWGKIGANMATRLLRGGHQVIGYCAIPVITMALHRRFRSCEKAPFSDKLPAALRRQFGDHALVRE